MAWLNAVLLYGLLNLFGIVVAIVVPALLELLEKSPRLAMLGFLLLVVSPAVAVAIIHHGGQGTLDRFDKSGSKEKGQRGIFPSVQSWWAGVVGWLILIGTSLVTTFIMLVIVPPEPDGSAMNLLNAMIPRLLNEGGIATVQTIIWVIVAAQFFNLERRARQADL